MGGSSPWRRVVFATLLLFVARAALAFVRSGPVLVADEIGYLTNARLLAGGVSGQLQLAPFYHGGYSLLLTPILWITSDPETAYRLVLVLNAALAASLLPLLYVLLTRFAQVEPAAAVAPAFAGALLPSVTVLSGAAMSENVLFPLTCTWLIALGGLLERSRAARHWAWALGAGLCAAALWAAHGRMIVAVGLTGALLLWLAASRRLSLAAAVVGLLALAGGLLAGHVLDAFLVRHNYGGHATNEANARLSGLAHPHGVLVAAENLAGAAWYVVVSSFGLAAVAWGKLARGRAGPLGLVLLAFTALLLLVSAASFTERERSDMLIYGRYVAVAVPPLIALALAGPRPPAWPAGTRRALAGLAGLTALVAGIRAGTGSLRAANRWNIADLPFLTFGLGPATLVAAAMVAAAGAWLLSRRWPPWPAAAAATLFLAVTVYGIDNPLLRSEHAVYPAGWTSPAPVAAAEQIGAVAYDLDRRTVAGHLYTVQWFLPHTRVALFHGHAGPAPSRYVLADRQAPPAVGLWRWKGSPLVLWARR